MLIKVISEHKVKNLEKKIFSFNKKEEKRIGIYEAIYGKLDALTYVDPRQSAVLVSMVTEIDRYVSLNNLYISKSIADVINRYCDYYRQVSTDFRRKDVRSENLMIQEYKNLFNG
jgi:hypothetical protein